MKVGRHLLTLSMAAGTAAVAAPETSIEQIAGSRAPVELQAYPTGRSSAAPEQITSSGNPSPATPQVTSERRQTRPPEQLSRLGKTAQAPQPLSRPVDGRQTAVERLNGSDLCDPAVAKLPKSRCRAVIENRSAEFSRPTPNPLSPEQRLLLEQEVREGALDSQNGARKLARSGQAEESLAAMGIAATVLQRTDKPEEREDDNVKKAAEIVGAVIGQPLTPPPPQ